MPRLSEKKACPKALIITSMSILEKSGYRKNFTPSEAPGSDSDT